MSLKPKKHSEIQKIKEKMATEKSKMNTKSKLPPYTMIVSEGTKTEPFYLKGFVNKINERYKDITKKPHIQIYGTGRNTRGLLKFVDRMIDNGEWGHYKKFWLVYDKDDFPLDDFDNTQYQAEARTNPCIDTAWSNESIELWFLLHFEDYHSDNGRKKYIEKLNQYIEYSKAREDLYDILMEKGSLQDAMRRSLKQHKEFLDAGESSPSKMVPATCMYKLVEELQKYLE